ETYWPAARMGWAWRPSGVPAAISARSMSPVAMCGMPKRVRSMFACVPLPLPGAPYSSRFIPVPLGERARERGACRPSLSYKAAVLAHHELRLQLLHGVQGDADDDQDRRPAEVHLLVGDARDLGRGDGRDHGDEPG